MRGTPLLNRALLEWLIKTRNFKFRRDELKKGLNRMNFKGPLKLHRLIPSLNYAVI